MHNFCEMSNIQIDEDLVQMHMKEAQAEDKVLQAHQDHIYICNTDEGKLIQSVNTNYMKTCLPDHLTT